MLPLRTIPILVLALVSQVSLIPQTSAVRTNSCNVRLVDGDAKKLLCVCNEQFCDQFKFKWPTEEGQASLVESSESGYRFRVTELGKLVQPKQALATGNQIRVDLADERQPIYGWGGAFTDSFGYNLQNLSRKVANELIDGYFGPNGLQYNFGRVPIGGSDFSTRAYSYDDTQHADYELRNWTLAVEDIRYKIPYIKQAARVAAKSGIKLKLIAAPWSPPKWMKTNNNFIRGFLKDEDKIYRSYTNYLMKFYDVYEGHGINFWGASVQNEPLSAFLPIYFFNSLQFNNEQQIKFITRYLGPALEARGWTKDKFKLIVGDDSLGFFNIQVPSILFNKEVQRYVSGVAFHWYTSGSIVPYDAINIAYKHIKDKIEFMLMTEACSGSLPLEKKVELGSWDRGEAYAVDIIEDLSRRTNGWIDWNLALDQQGGPNWSGNFVDSPIIVNAVKDEFYKQPMYYVLGHFSRFFKPDSIMVNSSVSQNHPTLVSDLMTAAVLNKETGHLVLNILNKSPDKQEIEINIENIENSDSKLELQPLVVEGRSMNSVVVKL